MIKSESDIQQKPYYCVNFPEYFSLEVWNINMSPAMGFELITSDGTSYQDPPEQSYIIQSAELTNTDLMLTPQNVILLQEFEEFEGQIQGVQRLILIL